MERKMPFILFLLTSLFCAAGLVHAQIGDRVLINGYSSFEFEKQFGDEGEGDPRGSFDVDLFDIVLNVYATNRLRVAADLTWEHGTATEDGRGNAAVEYAFGEYTVSEMLKIRSGKMFTHFGIYNEIHTAKPAFLTVKEPLSTNKNQKFGSEFRFYPRWLGGIAVLGGTQVGTMDMDYILQVSNGDQENTNPFEEDDNKHKAFGGRARLYPTRRTEIGVSFYSDKFTEFDSTGEDVGKRTSLFSAGGHFIWRVGPLGLEGEYVAGQIRPSFADNITRWAMTGMIFYSIQDIVVPYFRLEHLNPNTKVAGDNATLFVYGFNIQVDSGLFVKLELNTVTSDEFNNQFSGNNYTEFKGAIAIGF